MEGVGKIARRDFLKVTSLLGGGLLIGFPFVGKSEAVAATEFIPNAYIKLAADGQITLLAPNPEIGQGVKTALPMLLAEEMDLDWNSIQVEQAHYDAKKYGVQIAGGSGSVRNRWEETRKAGATARLMLVQAAAQKWGVSPEACTTQAGKVIHPKGSPSLAYADLVADAAKLPVPEQVKLKDKKDFRLIGKRIENVDNPAILTGKPLFGLDYRTEGMYMAVVARPPAFGLKLGSFDASAAEAIPGVHKVVQAGDVVAVLAKNTWTAKKGRDALKIDWVRDTPAESSAEQEKTLAALTETLAERPTRKDGNPEEQLTGGTVLEALYEAPLLPHATLEPMNFFADVKGDRAYLYGPVQTPARTQAEVARVLGIPAENIEIGLSRMGGGFGRRLMADFTVEAAQISAAAQEPVLLVWMREDDMQAGMYRPNGRYRYKAKISDSGSIQAWHLSAAALNSRRASLGPSFPAGTLENFRIDDHNLSSNVTTAPWRAPNHNIVCWAEQSFLDECAHAAGKDPLKLQLELLDRAIANPVGELNYDPKRYKGVIEAVAQMSKWDNNRSGGPRFQGFAAHYSFMSYVAEVVEIEMVNNKPKIVKVYAAVDCGQVVNLSGAENQIEGGIVDGIGHALFGELTLKEGKVAEQNFNAYRLAMLRDAPVQIETKFLDTPYPPTGLGEPGLPPAIPAFTNAIFAATGKRVRSLPLSKMDFNV
ncbi:Isoquinoline 1-oxidoreductase [Nitritalea halalkaliphila LW7]|uniref:Isoquinoline 1-oxidoreductase n=1 Tax=Nitritalea halalkaliphila LW7 TaxID=1189621 RepID=I5C3V6_9BACT|nr:molybdopterin cofactor-binding domain-containing protein [Nitritalea halalkaliphila]EIM76508.1 Isoquinoline 1-oxidoreductase [Nitritalea halalkaliphila LW7]